MSKHCAVTLGCLDDCKGQISDRKPKQEQGEHADLVYTCCEVILFAT